MCGIFGVWAPENRSAWGIERFRSAVIACRDELTHRGPDDAGIAIDGDIGLAHRRLAIIDPSPAGRMPMSNETDDVWATYNGEIYNFRDLRSSLVASGHRFRSRTDSEVLVHAYEEWGCDFLGRLDGMFALAIWDGRARRMILARDPIGKKPLFYSLRPGRRLLFGSTLAPLMRWPGAERVLSRRDARSYLQYGYVPSPRSILRGTRKVAPAGCVVIEELQLKTEFRFWDLAAIARSAEPLREREDEVIDRVERTVCEAVERRLVADVPIGAFLSGGIDSSLVALFLARLGGSSVPTFTARFTDAAFDESAFGAETARRLGIRNTVLTITPESIRELIPSVPGYLDEPMADFSFLPSLAIARAARQQVSVVLTGDGGDEPFAGYRGIWLARLFERYGAPVPHSLRAAVASAHRLVPRRCWALRRTLFRMRSADLAAFYAYHTNIQELGSDHVLGPRGGATRPEAAAAAFIRRQTPLAPIEACLLYDTLHPLVDAILTKVDRATMAFGLEARSPLLDKRVLELAFRVPFALKLKGRTTKYLLRRLLGRHLPPELVERPKQGFMPPLGAWLRNELRPMLCDLLAPARVARRGMFSASGVRTLVRQHQAGVADHTHSLWALLSLEMWMEHYDVR